MFTFAQIAGARAKVIGKADNGKTIVLVTFPKVTTADEYKAALAAAGYEDGYAAKHGWAWGGRDLGGAKRHFGDPKKAKAVVKAVNDSHAKAEPAKANAKKSTPKKSTPKAKDADLESVLKQVAENMAVTNKLLAALLG